MTQIKIYQDICPEALEDKVNDFLRAAPANVEILDVKYSVYRGMSPTHVVVVVYDVLEEELEGVEEPDPSYYHGFCDGVLAMSSKR